MILAESTVVIYATCDHCGFHEQVLIGQSGIIRRPGSGPCIKSTSAYATSSPARGAGWYASRKLPGPRAVLDDREPVQELL